MTASHLRVYHGPVADKRSGVLDRDDPAQQTISLPLGEVLPLLADVVNSHRTWLRDFQSDEITISCDLHEVLLAYRHFSRPSA